MPTLLANDHHCFMIDKKRILWYVPDKRSGTIPLLPPPLAPFPRPLHECQGGKHERQGGMHESQCPRRHPRRQPQPLAVEAAAHSSQRQGCISTLPRTRRAAVCSQQGGSAVAKTKDVLRSASPASPPSDRICEHMQMYPD